MKYLPFSFVCVFALAACTSVKVDRLVQEKLPKVPPQTVRQMAADDAAKIPSTKVATISMRTGSPFAADLVALAKEKTARLGGNVYVVTASESHTTVEGGLFSVMGDKTSASMTVDALRWKSQPAEPEPKKKPTGKRRWWWWF